MKLGLNSFEAVAGALSGRRGVQSTASADGLPVSVLRTIERMQLPDATGRNQRRVADHQRVAVSESAVHPEDDGAFVSDGTHPQRQYPTQNVPSRFRSQ